MKQSPIDIAALRKAFRPGTEIFTILRHRSKSGMYRAIDVYTFERNQPCRWTYTVAKALGWRYDKRHEALGVCGCGMDMGFHIINSLSYALHGHKRERAGYTLKHRWL